MVSVVLVLVTGDVFVFWLAFASDDSGYEVGYDVALGTHIWEHLALIYWRLVVTLVVGVLLVSMWCLQLLVVTSVRVVILMMGVCVSGGVGGLLVVSGVIGLAPLARPPQLLQGGEKLQRGSSCRRGRRLTTLSSSRSTSCRPARPRFAVGQPGVSSWAPRSLTHLNHRLEGRLII